MEQQVIESGHGKWLGIQEMESRIKASDWLGVVVHAYNPSTWEAKGGESP